MLLTMMMTTVFLQVHQKVCQVISYGGNLPNNIYGYSHVVENRMLAAESRKTCRSQMVHSMHVTQFHSNARIPQSANMRLELFNNTDHPFCSPLMCIAHSASNIPMNVKSNAFF